MESVRKYLPIFIGLLLMLRGLLWVVDGKKGNKRSLSLGLAAIVVEIGRAHV